MDILSTGAIYIGLGANLPHSVYGLPRETLKAALVELGARGTEVKRVSAWYRSAPVPASDQPWYVNSVAEIASNLSADQLLAELHDIEAKFGRTRTIQNASRAIDLDLPATWNEPDRYMGWIQ